MSINLLDLVKDQVSGQLAKQASSFLGESESGVAKALSGIMPALLGGVINKASSPEGAAGIMDMLSKLDMSSLEDISGIFEGGSSSVNGLLSSGGGIVESLMGSKASGVVDFIANMAGLKSSSSSSLMKMAAPLLMTVVGKQVQGKGLGFLTDLLMDQKSNVANALPAGLGSVLGFTDMLSKGSDDEKTTMSSSTYTATETAATAATKASSEDSSSLLKWLLPLLLAAGVIWWIAKDGCGKTVTETSMEMVDAANAEKDSIAAAMAMAMEVTKAKFASMDTTAKAAFDKLTLEDGSSPFQIKNYIDGGFNGDTKFQVKNVNFAAGSAALSKEAQAEIDNLAALLKVYTGVNLAINGHTDNTGDAAANKTLSQARAASVMGRLIAKGIDGARLSASGIGSDQAVADNATEEGRAQNRRIELIIQ
jgi:outer membrane protein OmpA-like peptidoglycan-associated protein